MIEPGSKVSIHYTLRVDEQVVDSSEGSEPLSYVQGENEIIEGLEESLAGMAPGDKKLVTIEPEKGYGERNEEAIHEVPKEAFDEPEELEVGGMVNGESDGNPFQAWIVDMDDENVTLDLNHPLAGKTLTFDVEIVEVN